MNEQNKILALYAALIACEGVQSMPQSWFNAKDALCSLMEDYDSKIHEISEDEIHQAAVDLANHPEAYGCG